MKNDILGVIIIVILLAGFGLFLAYSPQAEPAFGPVELSGGSIMVEDQVSEEEIFLAVELVEPGFVSVHEAMGDAPGAMVAASELLPAGSYDRLLLTPVAPLMPGQIYITILHMDDGDGLFDLKLDKAVSVDGAVVRPSFKVSTTNTKE
ncbi:MAG: hypothetical protein ACD_66C00236G0001 [uncultured bacterium]|uniref:DUF7282 domain-containing protein n=1 Tax=Candidatus Uhrbacteria bacterium GW2011_GWC1_41_20 TaxID=1618983 RepID=A0A0G0VEN3_9BACT|nr:MAG: hypothetical protein ACD_66C00236G0001 [uncultured bacterium]KKR22722.1 MAG: hypothetical protein UT52_C0008G0022 [Candidatus Uhrbacteria bacterium GW2011_GWE1_39_46]KKR64075.1 MAG: hypothetical protein UU04_C0006G0022 [Candidatus Uhrbacteria bacterium GW2011_GWC2_40_450]KKR90000.1 MAG: hypothetical protein UU40_C0010G0023 [Candidatus Uhrbacteria bacterium GW2011_GWD2_41_121]KKR95909.1 MAG: hypothetical protein UU46_C0011G0016 [Candidatus Uhrbacteria bacterium GW2011_GWD1_41_16]KKR9933